MSSRFHTPPAVARRLVALVAEATGGSLPEGVVLEPSVGGGALVLAWLDHEAGPASDPDSAERAAALVRGRLRASDVDPEAVAATRRALVLRCAPHLAADDPALASVRVGDGLSEPLPACVILCNPPWISYSGRHRGHAPGDDPRDDGGWPALHARAVSALVARLAPDGAAGFVLPGQMASLAGYAGLRRALAARVCRVELLGEGAFPGVVSPACLVALGPASDEPLVTSAAGRRVELPRALLLAEPERSWLPRLEDCFGAWPPAGFRLVPEAFTDLGLHSGNAAARLFHSLPFSGAVGVLEGRDVSPFEVAPPRRWFDPAIRPAPGEYFRVSQWERARACPIVLRQTASRPVAALNPGHPFRNSVLGGWGVPGLSPAAVVALLNTQVVAGLLAALSPDVRQRAFPQVKIGALRRLPWPAELSPQVACDLERLAGGLHAEPSVVRPSLMASLEVLARSIYAPILVRLGGVRAEYWRAFWP